MPLENCFFWCQKLFGWKTFYFNKAVITCQSIWCCSKIWNKRINNISINNNHIPRYKFLDILNFQMQQLHYLVNRLVLVCLFLHCWEGEWLTLGTGVGKSLQKTKAVSKFLFSSLHKMDSRCILVWVSNFLISL